MKIKKDLYTIVDTFNNIAIIKIQTHTSVSNYIYNIINNNSYEILLDEWFNEITPFNDKGIAIIRHNIKGDNILTKDGNILSPIWFYKINHFFNGYALVETKDHMYNFIDENGKLIREESFYSIQPSTNFINGFCMLKCCYSFNFINTNGEFLLDDYYKGLATDFDENGFSIVKKDSWKNMYNILTKDGKFLSKEFYFKIERTSSNAFIIESDNHHKNIMDFNGKIISDEWFSIIKDYGNNTFLVEKNNLYNIIDINGRLIFDDWLNHIINISNDRKILIRNKKYNIYQNNNIILNDWVDKIEVLNDDYLLKIKNNNLYNILNIENKFISDKWFDKINNFINGYACVEIFVPLNNKVGKEKYNFINRNGTLLSPKMWFDAAYDFNNNEIAIIKIENSIKIIDKNGNVF